MVEDSIKAKIAKLLAMTEDRGATSAEAAVALEKAQKLLAQHNLTMVDVRGAGEGRKDFEESEAFPAYPWARKVCKAIAKLYDCQYMCGAGPSHKAHQTFVGRQSNAETATLIAKFVVGRILKGVREAQKVMWEKSDPRYAKDFAAGCSEAVCARAEELWREANAEAIEAKRREQAAKAAARKAMEPNFSDLKPGTYKFFYVGKTFYYVNDAKVLNAVEAEAEFRKLRRGEGPKNVYAFVVKCIEGPLSSGEEYYYAVKAFPAGKQSRAVDTPRGEGYGAGKEAASSIGLHVQMGGSGAGKIS